MSLLDLFRSKPKRCSSCGALSAGVHRVYSGLRSGEETDKLCTNCLTVRLKKELPGKSIVFIEPLTCDGYCYFPMGEAGNQGLTQDRVSQALSSLAPKCAACSSKPHHLWMPLADLDNPSMEKQPTFEYWAIPNKPALWKETYSFCDEHMSDKIKDFVGQKREYFQTFRFPTGPNEGYYW